MLEPRLPPPHDQSVRWDGYQANISFILKIPHRLFHQQGTTPTPPSSRNGRVIYCSEKSTSTHARLQNIVHHTERAYKDDGTVDCIAHLVEKGCKHDHTVDFIIHLVDRRPDTITKLKFCMYIHLSCAYLNYTAAGSCFLCSPP